MKIIVIDPGHGRRTGASADGYWEDEIVLRISKDLCGLINHKDNGNKKNLRSVLTRNNDFDNPSLKTRCNLSNDMDADLFLSIHVNAFMDEDVNGCETWIFDRPSELGTAIHKAIAYQFTKDRGIKSSVRDYQPGHIYVLQHTKAPAVLVELGFITNPMERDWLVNYRNQKVLAGALYYGITSFFS